MAETLSPKSPEPPRPPPAKTEVPPEGNVILYAYIFMYIGVSANAPGCNDPIAAPEQGLCTRQST